MTMRRRKDGGTLVQQVVQAVRTHIRIHDLKVGDSLPGEGQFAATLGVSRAVMREAFGALAALRLVDVGNGRRPRVGALDGMAMGASLDQAVATAQISVEEVMEVRRTIEVRTAALAARKRSDAQARQIVMHAEAMEQARDDLPLMTRHDIAFHECIAVAAGNELFTQILRSFVPFMTASVPRTWRNRIDPDQMGAAILRHRRLGEAIADGDASEAQTAMAAHFDAALDIL